MGKVSDTRTAYTFAFEVDGERVKDGNGREAHVTLEAGSESAAVQRIAAFTKPDERAVIVATITPEYRA